MKYTNSKWVASAEYKNGKVVVNTKYGKYKEMRNHVLKPTK
jgi:hypothetical protein